MPHGGRPLWWVWVTHWHTHSRVGAGWVLDVPKDFVARAVLGFFTVGMLLVFEVAMSVMGLVSWLSGQLVRVSVLQCLFAIFSAALVLSDGDRGTGRVWERIAWIAAAALAVGTGSLPPGFSLVWWLASRAVGALAWLFKPHLYVATAMLRLALQYLMPLPLLDRLSNGSPLSQKVCDFVGHVQLVAPVQSNTRVANPWWIDLQICVLLVCSVVSLMDLQGVQAGSSSSCSMRLAVWIDDVSKKLTGLWVLFRRYVY